jgi:hypothetical protein
MKEQVRFSDRANSRHTILHKVKDQVYAGKSLVLKRGLRFSDYCAMVQTGSVYQTRLLPSGMAPGNFGKGIFQGAVRLVNYTQRMLLLNKTSLLFNKGKIY